MAAGDETILGPEPCTTAGVLAMGAFMDTAYVGANDRYVQVNGPQGLQFWVIHIEGA